MNAALPRLLTDPARSALAGVAALLDALPDAAWVVDGEHRRVLVANARAGALLGRGELEGLDAEDLLDTLEDHAFWEAARAGDAPLLDSEAELSLSDGRCLAVMRRIAPMRLGDGASGFLVAVRDRSHERQIEIERETALAEMRATLEATADAILVTDLAGRLRAFNRCFARLWHLPQALLQTGDEAGIRAWMRMNVMEVDGYDRRLEEVQAQCLTDASDEFALVSGARIERHAKTQWCQGRAIGRVFSFRELNPRRIGAARDAGAEGRDELTGMTNRTGFLRKLAEALQSGRGGDGFTVLCIEFEDDAQACGTGPGARLAGPDGDAPGASSRLRELAALLQGAVRLPHCSARLGGSRFGVLIEHVGEAAGEAAARRLIEAQAQAGGAPVAIGLVCHPGAGLAADDILRQAESALHRAKQGGQAFLALDRGGFDAWQNRRARLAEALRGAIAAGHLRLAAQAGFDARTGAPRSVQMELRWRDRDLGEVAPPHFLAVAQECGLQGELDEWALEHGLLRARQWRAAGHELRLAVRISDGQLGRPDCARRVAAALEAGGWPAGDLELDIHETALESDAALRTLRALGRLGVHLCLVAFGTGATALGGLRRVRLSGVRLDASLVRAGERDGDGAEARWLRLLVQVAHAMDLEVHACGVDRSGQWEALAALGCDTVQGRALATWMEERAFESWLASKHRARRRA